MTELNAAEWNVVETLDAAIFASKMTVVTEEAREEIARAVVAAVRGPIADEALKEAAGEILLLADRAVPDVDPAKPELAGRWGGLREAARVVRHVRRRAAERQAEGSDRA